MRYGHTDVLTGVTFAAQRGEVVALLGPNGAGNPVTELRRPFRPERDRWIGRKLALASAAVCCSLEIAWRACAEDLPS
jgi:hypothetical protein